MNVSRITSGTFRRRARAGECAAPSWTGTGDGAGAGALSALACARGTSTTKSVAPHNPSSALRASRCESSAAASRIRLWITGSRASSHHRATARITDHRRSRKCVRTVAATPRRGFVVPDGTKAVHEALDTFTHMRGDIVRKHTDNIIAELKRHFTQGNAAGAAKPTPKEKLDSTVFLQELVFLLHGRKGAGQ